MPRVTAVNISDKKGVVKHPIEKGFFEEDFGLTGDAHAGKWHRQVSLLAKESIDKMTASGIEGLCVGIFAENLTTEGIEVFKLPIGTRLKIGETEMEITQIGKECHVGCEVFKTVGACIMPKEGVFARVLKSGWIKPGDEIQIIGD